MTPLLGLMLAMTLVSVIAGMSMIISGGTQREELTNRSAEIPLTAAHTRFYDRFAGWVETTGWGARVTVRLEQAALPFSAADYALGTIFLGLGAFLLARTILPSPFAAVLALGLMWIGWLWIKHKQAQRRQKFIRQLADVARILSGAASAGLSVGAGIAVAGRELDEPAATEMRLVAERLSIGGTMDQAMDEMRKRVPSREVGVLISTMVIQQRAGGDAVRSLADIAVSLESRADTMQDVKGILGRALNATYIMPILVYTVLLLSNKLRPDTVRHIFTDAIGIIAMAVATTLIIAGVAIARRVSDVERWDRVDESDDPDEGSWDRIAS